jgi:hypothetical protein
MGGVILFFAFHCAGYVPVAEKQLNTEFLYLSFACAWMLQNVQVIFFEKIKKTSTFARTSK